MIKHKYNYILIFKDGKVPQLPESKRHIEIHESKQGWKAAIGSWNKEQIEDFEYYRFDFTSNWKAKTGWQEILL